MLLRDLNKKEARLGLDETKLSPITMEILDALLEERQRLKVPDINFMGMPVGSLMNLALVATYEFYDYMHDRRIRRMAGLAPGALSDEDTQIADEERMTLAHS